MSHEVDRDDEREDGDREDRPRDIPPEHVLRVRLGHGANCSSIGSVVDTLFATATVGAAVFAAVVAALAREPVKVRARAPAERAERPIEPPPPGDPRP